MKILIVRFSSIGDIVLTTPVVRCVKKQMEGIELHYLTKSSFQSILSSNPYIDKVHTLSEDWDGLIRELQGENFDYIVDLHHNLRTKRIKRALSSAKYLAFDKLNVQKWLLTMFKIDKMSAVHIVDRYLDTVSILGVQNDGKGLDYFIPEKDQVSLDKFFPNLPKQYVGFVIGASYATKKLPLHKLIEVCQGIDAPILLLGGKEDAVIGQEILATLPNRLILNTCGQFNLNQSASLVEQASFIISHDTGLMHIASAFQKPILSIWGNTVPAFGMYPYLLGNVFHEMAEVNDLSCRPCSKIGYKKCPKRHFKCMEMQNAKRIAQSCNTIMLESVC